MKYLEFEKAFRDYPIFSLIDIKKRFPDFDNRRLVEWQQKDYIIKVRRAYYCFEDRRKDEQFLYLTANKIYSPSYVSFESALAYYNFIPEGVFITISATTRNTANYETAIGIFTFKHLKSELFFGYKLTKVDESVMKIAEPEKVVLDYLYMNKLNSIMEIKEMRFNEIQIKEIIDFKKMDKYQKIFNSRILDKRVRLFKKVINA